MPDYSIFTGGSYRGHKLIGKVSAGSESEARKIGKAIVGKRVKVKRISEFASESFGGKRLNPRKTKSLRAPRKVKGHSTTLRNMATVTIRKLPNGVVKISGRKMAGNPPKRKYRPRIRGGYAGDKYTAYYDYKAGKILYKRKARKR